ncbi:hypothetical protein [Bradyrhizobium sp. I1.14.4]|uniref:hypothetical protein n=1 Tax=unclassified Bradyrhizobium TaxID=2631580 RepID=UPI003D19F4E2
MAAATIASGAVGWSDGAVAVAVGLAAGAAVTGAIRALTVAALDGSGCGAACVAADLSLVDCASVLDFESSDFDFDLVLRGVSLSPSTLLPSRELPESGNVRSGAVLLSRERASVVVDEPSDRREGAGWESYRLLSLVDAVLLSTSAAKPSFPACEAGSGRADRCVAP